MTARRRIQCPCCGQAVTLEPYDIGSGPEMCCPHCDWCWGVNGQPLRPYDPPPEVQQWLQARSRGDHA